jgi:hypothetical protein
MVCPKLTHTRIAAHQLRIHSGRHEHERAGLLRGGQAAFPCIFSLSFNKNRVPPRGYGMWRERLPLSTVSLMATVTVTAAA